MAEIINNAGENTVALPSVSAPSITTNKLYNESGVLMFDGVSLEGIGFEDANGNITISSTATVPGASADNNIAIGTGTTVSGTGADDNIVIGNGANITGNFTAISLAIGGNASVLNGANGSIAIGENASVDGVFDAIAIGTDATVTANAQGIAIGEGAVADHIRALEISNHIKTAFVQTTDATPTVLFSKTLFASTCSNFRVQAMGYDQVANEVTSVEIRGAIKRGAAGGAAIVGSTDTFTTEDAGASPWSIVVQATGNDLEVEVTGEAAHTIDWRCRVDFEIIS